MSRRPYSGIPTCRRLAEERNRLYDLIPHDARIIWRAKSVRTDRDKGVLPGASRSDPVRIAGSTEARGPNGWVVAVHFFEKGVEDQGIGPRTGCTDRHRTRQGYRSEKTHQPGHALPVRAYCPAFFAMRLCRSARSS